MGLSPTLCSQKTEKLEFDHTFGVSIWLGKNKLKCVKVVCLDFTEGLEVRCWMSQSLFLVVICGFSLPLQVTWIYLDDFLQRPHLNCQNKTKLEYLSDSCTPA